MSRTYSNPLQLSGITVGDIREGSVHKDDAGADTDLHGYRPCDALKRNDNDFDQTLQYLMNKGHKADQSSLEAMKPKPKNEATPLTMTNSAGMLRLQKEFPDQDKIVLNATLKAFDYNAEDASKYLHKHGHKMHLDKMDRSGENNWSGLTYYESQQNPSQFAQKSGSRVKPIAMPSQGQGRAVPQTAPPPKAQSTMLPPRAAAAPPPVPSRKPSQAMERPLSVDPFAAFLNQGEPTQDCARGCGEKVKTSMMQVHDDHCTLNLVECSGAYLRCDLTMEQIIEPMIAEMQMMRFMIQAQKSGSSSEESDAEDLA
ncbi:hypothetical protein PROFUN_05590 [Planoprotostelium fungivorum]|uniref:Uncharacterized protein n=1 Tax=Planoprotostelium fungivorum TaxID=1890364 RepID=A0A2P6N066_9EUKA|nr:hypothetical protein PROFUN_05590 [Planoprotostelium fungivorum]